MFFVPNLFPMSKGTVGRHHPRGDAKKAVSQIHIDAVLKTMNGLAANTVLGNCSPKVNGYSLTVSDVSRRSCAQDFFPLTSNWIHHGCCLSRVSNSSSHFIPTVHHHVVGGGPLVSSRKAISFLLFLPSFSSLIPPDPLLLILPLRDLPCSPTGHPIQDLPPSYPPSPPIPFRLLYSLPPSPCSSSFSFTPPEPVHDMVIG